MFWRKRSNTQLEDNQDESVFSLATRLGVEHRKNERILYPENLIVCGLPSFFFGERQMQVKNISVGGCCIMDREEVLGPSIGQDIELDLHWPDKIEPVRSRIVSRVDLRRHIQFLDISPQRQIWLRKSMTAGSRGLTVKQHHPATDAGPNIEATELWSSPNGDSVILENHVHRLGRIYFREQQYILCQGAWPCTDTGNRCQPEEFEKLLLFLANIPSPSEKIKGLFSTLTILYREGVAE